MTSFLLEEDIILKHVLNFNLKYNQNVSFSKINRFSSDFEATDFHVYQNHSFPVNYQALVENHYTNESIQNLVNLKKKRLNWIKKENVFSVSHG